MARVDRLVNAAAAGPAGGYRRLMPAMSLLAAIGGVILIVLAGPRLMAGLAALRSDSVLKMVEHGRQPTPEALARLVESRRDAAAWAEDGRLWLAVGLARLASARKVDRADLQRRILDRAIYAIDRSLALAPGNAVGWMRLAEALLLRAGPSPRAAQALQMSVRNAPVAPEFAVERLRLLLQVWDEFNDAGRDMVTRQVQIIQANPRAAARLARLRLDGRAGTLLRRIRGRLAAAAE